MQDSQRAFMKMSPNWRPTNLPDVWVNSENHDLQITLRKDRFVPRSWTSNKLYTIKELCAQLNNLTKQS